MYLTKIKRQKLKLNRLQIRQILWLKDSPDSFILWFKIALYIHVLTLIGVRDGTKMTKTYSKYNETSLNEH